jgi:hypothetical protein
LKSEVNPFKNKYYKSKKNLKFLSKIISSKRKKYLKKEARLMRLVMHDMSNEKQQLFSKA